MDPIRPIELSARLLALAGQVPGGARFADIGTDHARLPVWLLERGVIPYAIATDLRKGPLEHARRTAERHNVTERVSFRLGDGLRPLTPGEVDVCAIAGMGGETISAILSDAPWTAQGTCRFLLQPMTSVPDLRAWLWRNGFTIEQERLVGEGDTIYVLLTVSPGSMEPLTPPEEWAGRQRNGETSLLRGEYLRRVSRRAEGALEGLRRSTRPEDLERLPAWESLIQGLNEMREEWEAWQR